MKTPRTMTELHALLNVLQARTDSKIISLDLDSSEWEVVRSAAQAVATMAKRERDRSTKPYVVVDVTTNKVVDYFMKDSQAAKKAAKNPNKWLSVHKSHLGTLGVTA